MDRFLSLMAMGLSFLLLYLSIFVIQPQPRIITVAILTTANSVLMARIVYLHRFLRPLMESDDEFLSENG